MASNPKLIALAPTANDVDLISTTESITSPWALQLDGTLTLSTPQHVSVTVTSNESGETFTVAGTDRYGATISEDLAGPNNTVVVGSKNFATVTSITGTADATGVTAGVNGTAESQWYILNYRGSDFNVGFGVDLSTSASLTYSVEHTFYDFYNSTYVEDSPPEFTHSSVASETTAQFGDYTSPPTAIRLAITAHSSGSANLRVVKSGGS